MGTHEGRQRGPMTSRTQRVWLSRLNPDPLRPVPSAAPPAIGGRFITTKPARSRCSTRRFATISAMISSALCDRFRP